MEPPKKTVRIKKDTILKEKKIKKTLNIEDLECIIDTREQKPLDLSPLRSCRGTLSCADYSIRGLTNVIAVERKSCADLVACCTHERERFEREIQRLLAYPHRLIVVECHLSDIEDGNYRSKASPSSVLGSVLGFIASGVPILFAGDHAAAGKLTARFLFIAARRRWRESLALIEGRKVS